MTNLGRMITPFVTERRKMQVDTNRLLSLIVLALPLTSKLLDFILDQYSSAHWDTIILFN